MSSPGPGSHTSSPDSFPLSGKQSVIYTTTAVCAKKRVRSLALVQEKLSPITHRGNRPQAACLVCVWLGIVSAKRSFPRDIEIRRFSESLSPAIDHASTHTSALIMTRPMISTMCHLTISPPMKAGSFRSAGYAAYRLRTAGCSAASIDLSFVALNSLPDPFAFGYTKLKHTKKVATSATSPNTIPQ